MGTKGFSTSLSVCKMVPGQMVGEAAVYLPPWILCDSGFSEQTAGDTVGEGSSWPPLTTCLWWSYTGH